MDRTEFVEAAKQKAKELFGPSQDLPFLLMQVEAAAEKAFDKQMQRMFKTPCDGYEVKVEKHPTKANTINIVFAPYNKVIKFDVFIAKDGTLTNNFKNE